ncbi:hypothetical protein ACOMHN_021811 [Nucella lapillus]
MAECRIPGHITGLYVFAVVNLCALLNISLVNAEVFVVDVEKNATIDTIRDRHAMFGPDLPAEGLVGRVVYVIPNDACHHVDPPPSDPYELDLPWIALIKRGPCHFDLKVLEAQRANYSAAIVHNSLGDHELVQMGGGQSGYSAAIVHNHNGSNDLMPMGGDSSYADQVKIPSVFVGFDNGMDLAKQYNYTHKWIVIKIVDGNDQPPPSFFLPFVIVVCVCFLGIIVFSIIKCIKYFQHIRRTRLSKSALKKIPTRKYRKGDHYDTCAICLEDYEEGEKLRVLPCDHTYHCKCIDPWLTKRKKTCPQCKRRVIPGQDSDSDSDGGEEEGGASETTPLLANNNNRAPSGPSGLSGRSSRAGSSGSLGHSAALVEQSGGAVVVQPEVVVITEGQATANTAIVTVTGEDDSSSNDEGGEELQGAVGGVGISDRKDFEQDSTNVIVEVEPSCHSDPPSTTTTTTATTTPEPATDPANKDTASLDPLPADANPASLDSNPGGRPSPAPAQGSINGAFTPSGSSEDEDGSSGSGNANSGGSAHPERSRRKKQQQGKSSSQVV